jgi:hypothetical protein
LNNNIRWILMHNLQSSTCGHSVLAAVTKPVHAISNRRLKDFISSREYQVLQYPFMTFYSGTPNYRALVDITNTGNYMILMSQIQETTWYWCHKYRELADIDVTNTGNYLAMKSQIQGTIWHRNTNTGNYLALISQIQVGTWHWYHKYKELPDIDIKIQATIWHWCHKYTEITGNEITNTGNYLAMKSQIQGTTWHW